MTRFSKMGLAALVAVALAAVPAVASDMTVGQFLVQVAKARQVAAVDPASAEQALRASGVTLPTLNLGKSLTEGDVVAIASGLGVRVTTSRPEAPFSQRQADGFISSFGSTLAPGGTQPNPTPNNTTNPDPQPGKGKSKGHTKTPGEPV